MKTPEQYADELIAKHINPAYENTDTNALLSAIVDVNNTIDALRNINEQIDIVNYDYYMEVLTILKRI